MVTRWAYEALCVEQYKSNGFEKPFFRYDMEISENDWYASFLIPTLKVKINECLFANKAPEYSEYTIANLGKIKYHVNELSSLSGILPGKWVDNLNYNEFNEYVGNETKIFLDSLRTSFRIKSRAISNARDSLFKQISARMGEDKFIEMREKDYNENLANVVLNRLSTNKIYDSEDKLIQKADPVLMKPGSKWGRAHFFAPYKQIGNLRISTLIFDLIVIWLMVFVLFVALYYNILKKFIRFLESLKLPIIRKYGRELLQF
jgi:hypothetical protein